MFSSPSNGATMLASYTLFSLIFKRRPRCTASPTRESFPLASAFSVEGAIGSAGSFGAVVEVIGVVSEAGASDEESGVVSEEGASDEESGVVSDVAEGVESGVVPGTVEVESRVVPSVETAVVVTVELLFVTAGVLPEVSGVLPEPSTEEDTTPVDVTAGVSSPQEQETSAAVKKTVTASRVNKITIFFILFSYPFSNKHIAMLAQKKHKVNTKI